MVNNKELAQKIIDKYIGILGLYPVLVYSRQIPNLNLNSRGIVRSISDDLNTLNSLINIMEKITGKFVKSNIIKKFLTDYDKKEEIV
jgi:hypothetical protein